MRDEKKHECGARCFACILCEKEKICCNHNFNVGYHACVKWQRTKKKQKDAHD